MIREIDNYYLSKEEPTKGCLLALRRIILEQDTEVMETMSYSMPCFRYRNKPFCYLWTDKKTDEPYILFVEGKHLNHHDLEVGNRSRMKIFRVNSDKNMQLKTIKLLLKSALELYQNGTIKIK